MSPPATTDLIQPLVQSLPTALEPHTVNLILTHLIFQEKTKEWITSLIDEKHIAQHRAKLLTPRKNTEEENETFMDQLEFWYMESEKQATQIATMKTRKLQMEEDKREMISFYDTELRAHEDAAEMLRKSYDASLARVKQSGEIYIRDFSENARLKIEIDILKSKAKGFDTEERLLGELQRLNQQRASVESEFIEKEERISNLETELLVAKEENNRLRESRSKRFDEGLDDPEVENEARDQEDEASGAVIFTKAEDGTRQLKAATREKLVERITYAAAHESIVRQAFLLTYRSFMSTGMLIDLLIKRFRESSSEITSTPSGIQVRTCTIVKYWVDGFWSDFNTDVLQRKLMNFVQVDVQTKFPKLAEMMMSSITKKGLVEKEKPNVISASAPKPILPKGLARKFADRSSVTIEAVSPTTPCRTIPGTFSFSFPNARTYTKDALEYAVKIADLDPQEIARQLTLLEFQLYERIKPTEFIDLAWMKEHKETNAANICMMTAWSNHVVRWIETEIVTCQDLKLRAQLYEKFVMVGHWFDKSNNLNGVQEVMAALSGAAIHRLHKTKELVTNKGTKIMEDLTKLTAGNFNFANMRNRIRPEEAPLIPFPGLYQTDLTMIDGSQKSEMKSDSPAAQGGLINFTKQQKIASYITDFLAFQQTKYEFEPIFEIMEYIQNSVELDPSVAWDMSLQVEPRDSAKI